MMYFCSDISLMMRSSSLAGFVTDLLPIACYDVVCYACVGIIPYNWWQQWDEISISSPLN